MRPREASMETFPHKWWFLFHPNKKDLPTCWQPINQVLGQSLLPHKPAVRTSEMALGPLRPHPHGPAPAHASQPLGRRWEPGLMCHPKSLVSLGEFFKNSQRQPHASSNPSLLVGRDFPGFLPRFIIEQSQGDFPNQ